MTKDVPAGRPADSAGRRDVEVRLVKIDPGLPTPHYAKPGDAGADLYAALEVDLAPGERRLVPTGVSIALPVGFAGFVHPRSGLSVKHGVGIVNAPGTIDSGYRGEIKVNLINHDPHDHVVLRRGDRIAQLVVQQVAHAVFIESDDLPASDRGEQGFGSTG